MSNTVALYANAYRQWADYREDADELAGTYYVNVYYDMREGFVRRNTVKDGLTKRQAERLVRTLNTTAKHLGTQAIK